jgi:FlaA1/EpsC-like NDP-sugar epimerase
LDALICCLSVYLSIALRLDIWSVNIINTWSVYFYSVGLTILIFTYFGFYKVISRHIDLSMLSKFYIKFLSIYFIFFFTFIILVPSGVPRGIIILQPIILFILLIVSRLFLAALVGKFVSYKFFKDEIRMVLIYGAGYAGRQLLSSLINVHNIKVISFIDDDISLFGSSINGVKIFSSNEIRNLIIKYKISDILLAMPNISQANKRDIVNSLKSFNVRVKSVPKISDIAFGGLDYSDLIDFDVADLLGRKIVPPDFALINNQIRDKCILVTGAGGSIGGELCRQILVHSPSYLVLYDFSEVGLHLIYEDLKKMLHLMNSQNQSKSFEIPTIIPCLGSVLDESKLRKIYFQYRPNTVFHAAAYKHVPLVELNIEEALRNNIFGTLNCANLAAEHGVDSFTLISTDKAVSPTSVMGASKRVAELVLQALTSSEYGANVNYSIVRFGNVLGSSGSVVPLFRRQIREGGPITLTHKEITRYFMTIPEAAQLVLQANAIATGGDVFVLDMGDPVKIYDLALNMIYLSGFIPKDKDHPHGDIEIQIIGLRPGEKLFEELLIGQNPQTTVHPKIIRAEEDFFSWIELNSRLNHLNVALIDGKLDQILIILKSLVHGFNYRLN